MQEIKEPEINRSAFNCPHCDAYAHQRWGYLGSTIQGNNNSVDDLEIAYCEHCGNYSLWFKEKIIFPKSSGVQTPNEDLGEGIKTDYNEAKNIVNDSPRGACALLRLALQKICKQLGEKGKDINEDIGNLVEKGLSFKIQQSLDIVRVIGNEAVHPGKLDLKDDRETAIKLFNLINIIAEIMITQPKKIEETYNSLPEEKIEQINTRDNTKT